MKKLIKFLRSKKKFLPPKNKRYLILDSSQSFIFKNYFEENEMDILHTRYQEFNLYVLIRMLLKLKFSYREYVIEYIKVTNCKYIISIIENNLFYYSLKKSFPDKKIILIQSGMRTEFFFEQMSKLKHLEVDYMFTFGKFYEKKFNQFVKAKFITLGSFKNNLILNDRKKKNRSILFISSGPLFVDDMGVFGKLRIESEIYFNSEKILLPMILKFCQKNEYELKVLARSKKSRHFSYEKNFYEKILNSSQFEFLENNHWDQSYKFTDNSKLIISIYSALGLESLARGNRTIFFNVRNRIKVSESLSLFWSDKKISSKGAFWTDLLNEEELNRIASYGIFSTDQEWKKSLELILPDLMDYNKGNKRFLEVIRNEK